jgi:hypothetical protein
MNIDNLYPPLIAEEFRLGLEQEKKCKGIRRLARDYDTGKEQ